MQMLANTKDCRIPTAMVPHDPINGHQMAVNLRCDDTFVEDANWHKMLHRYQQFVEKAKDKKLVLLEFGIGFNTPSIIRFPFEQMAERFPDTILIRFNNDYPQLMAANPKNFICIKEDINKALSFVATPPPASDNTSIDGKSVVE